IGVIVGVAHWRHQPADAFDDHEIARLTPTFDPAPEHPLIDTVVLEPSRQVRRKGCSEPLRTNLFDRTWSYSRFPQRDRIRGHDRTFAPLAAAGDWFIDSDPFATGPKRAS